jgi:hypothetical protein
MRVYRPTQPTPTPPFLTPRYQHPTHPTPDTLPTPHTLTCLARCFIQHMKVPVYIRASPAMNAPPAGKQGVLQQGMVQLEYLVSCTMLVKHSAMALQHVCCERLSMQDCSVC